MKHWPLRIKLTCWSILIVGVALGVSLFSTRTRVRAEEIEELDGELQHEAQHLLEQFQRHGSRLGWINRREIEEVMPDVQTPARSLIIADHAGRVLYRSDERIGEEWLQLPPGLHYARREQTDLRLCNGTDGRSIIFCFATDLSEINGLLAELTHAHLVGLPMVLAVAVGGGLWLARQALRPIKVIADAADAIRPEDLSARLENLSSRDDIGRLARAFNRMLERLERGFRQATRFSADASHELRTPLTVLHSSLADLLGDEDLTDRHRETIADLQLQTLGLISMANSLLLLTRADAGRLQLQLEEADFAEIVTECLEDARIVAEQRGIAIECLPLPASPVRVDAARIRQVLSNLFDNAIKYNEPGGRMAVGFSHAERQLRLRIGNSGPGISDAARQHLFERFYRAGQHEDIPGAGLGLSLARELARSHGGELLLSVNRPGWTEFELQLPQPA